MVRAAISLFTLFVLVTLVWAGIRANSAWQYYAAESIAGRLPTDEALPAAELRAAEVRIDRALALLPGRPEFLSLRGYLLELKARQVGVVGKEKTELLEQAAGDYRAALATRPIWPYNWSDLLTVKEKLNQVDHEFVTALQRGAETGPWEPRVLLEVIRVGLRRWDQLNSPQRKLVMDAIDRAFIVEPRLTFDLIRFYSRPDLVCTLQINQPQIDQWCSMVLIEKSRF